MYTHGLGSLGAGVPRLFGPHGPGVFFNEKTNRHEACAGVGLVIDRYLSIYGFVQSFERNS
jgi:hypothetical protein